MRGTVIHYLDKPRLYCFFSFFNLASGLKKLREKGGSTTRKLIGHSAPVYSLSFDPVQGTAAPPRYLLSASADGTTRLWSLDTMTNPVAYRGHQNPIWDVEWSPLGIYFATGSRDRTARLWNTERPNALRVFAGHLSDVDVSLSRRPHSSSLFYYSALISDEPSPGTSTGERRTVRQVPPQFTLFSDGIERSNV